jgi:hypothetical protein
MQSSFDTMPSSTHAANQPRTETERIVFRIWSEVLKTDRLGIYDDFIELGGHSLSATLCINRISEACSVVLPLDLFFLEPAHVAEIAAQIDRLRAAGTAVRS